MVNDDIPLNAGCMKPITLVLPDELHDQPQCTRRR